MYIQKKKKKKKIHPIHGLSTTIKKKSIKYLYVTQSTQYNVHHNHCVTTGREGWNKENSQVAV